MSPAFPPARARGGALGVVPDVARSQQLLLVVLRARGALAHLFIPLVGQRFHLDAPVVEVLGRETGKRLSVGQGQAQGQGREGAAALCLVRGDGRQDARAASKCRLTVSRLRFCGQEVTEGLTQNRRRRQDGAMLKNKKKKNQPPESGPAVLCSALPRTGCVTRQGHCTALGLSLPGYQGRQLTASATWAGGRRK